MLCMLCIVAMYKFRLIYAQVLDGLVCANSDVKLPSEVTYVVVHFCNSGTDETNKFVASFVNCETAHCREKS